MYHKLLKLFVQALYYDYYYYHCSVFQTYKTKTPSNFELSTLFPTAPQTLLHTNPLSTSRHISMLLASKNSQDMTATSSLEPFQSLHLPPSQPRTAEDILSVEETTTSISFSSPFPPTQILATSTLTYQHQLTTSKSRDSKSAPLPLPSQPLTLDATSDKGTWILLHSLQPSIPKTTISSSPIQKSYFLTDIGSVAYSSQDVLPSIPDIKATSTEVFAVHYLSTPESHSQTIVRNTNVLFYGTKRSIPDRDIVSVTATLRNTPQMERYLRHPQ